MPLLPSDFALPALPYLLGLLVAAAASVGFWYRRRPPVTEGTVAALAPWMAAGGTLYAMYQVGAFPATLAPLFGSPAVYVTVGVVAAAVWATAADRPAEGWRSDAAPGRLVLTGTAVFLATLVVALTLTVGSSSVWLSTLITLASIALAAATWGALGRVREVDSTGAVGVLVVFGHALDGVSTAVGYDHLGFGEQTPLSRAILETSAGLPTADVLGAGWLFVVVKLALAAVVVALFDDYVREAPREGYLLLGLIAAVGLGPGVHNVVLFAIS